MQNIRIFVKILNTGKAANSSFICSYCWMINPKIEAEKREDFFFFQIFNEKE